MRDLGDYSRKYKSEPGEYYQALYRKRAVLAQVKKHSHQHILEVGCGLDPIFNHTNDYQDMTVVEPSVDFYRIALKSVNYYNNVYLYNMTVEEFSETYKKDECYDFIIVSSLLHEVEKPDALLQSVKALCDSNTVVHINVPNANSFHRIIAAEMGLISNEYELSEQQIMMQRKRVYDMKTLKEIVCKNGFQILEDGGYMSKFLTGAQMDNAINCNIVNKDIYDGLYELGKRFPNNGSEIYVNIRKIDG